ncbi:hypothetical protein D3C72_799040 [compost metagenome]
MPGFVAFLDRAQSGLLLTDPRQRVTLAVELRGCLADARPEPPLIGRQLAGINPRLRELGALTLHGLTQAVVFELQVSSRFLRRFQCARLCERGCLGVFKLDGQRGRFLFRLVQ